MRTHRPTRSFVIITALAPALCFVGDAFASQSTQTSGTGTVQTPGTTGVGTTGAAETDTPGATGSVTGSTPSTVGPTTDSPTATTPSTGTLPPTSSDPYSTTPAPEPISETDTDATPTSVGVSTVDSELHTTNELSDVDDDDDDRNDDYVRFRVEVVPISYSYGVEWDGDDRSTHSLTLLGGLPVQNRASLRTGLGTTSGLGFGVGYLWDNRIGFGVRIGLGYRYLNGEDGVPTSHVVTYSFTPEFDYYFRSDERVNPLITLRAGMIGSYQKVNGSGTDEVDINTVGPVVGAGAGVAWWAARRFAFDTRLVVDYAPLWSSGVDSDVTEPEGYDGYSHNVSVSLVTGFSFGIPDRNNDDNER